MFHPRLLSGLLVLGAIALGKPVAAQESCPNCPPCPQNVCPPPPAPAPRDVTVPSQAYPTLQAGIDAVADGGTVHVLPGNYLESVTIVKRVNLVGRRRAGRAPTITGADLATDVIHYGSGGGGRVAHLALVAHSQASRVHPDARRAEERGAHGSCVLCISATAALSAGVWLRTDREPARRAGPCNASGDEDRRLVPT